MRERCDECNGALRSDTETECNRLCFERGFEAGREAAAGAVRKLSRINSAYEDAIRALPLPVCNPLLVCQNCRRACRRGTATSAVSKLMSQMPHNT